MIRAAVVNLSERCLCDQLHHDTLNLPCLAGEPLDDGHYCSSAKHCCSGRCINNKCKITACAFCGIACGLSDGDNCGCQHCMDRCNRQSVCPGLRQAQLMFSFAACHATNVSCCRLCSWQESCGSDMCQALELLFKQLCSLHTGHHSGGDFQEM